MPRTFRPGLAQQTNLYKPPPGSQINWDHPWADGLQFAVLLNEKGGLTVHDLKKRREGTLQTGATFDRGGLDITGSGFVDVPEADDAPFTGELTILGRWAIDSGSAFRHFAGKHAGAGGTNNPFDFRTDNSANPSIRLIRANAGGSREWAGANYGTTFGVFRTIGVAAPVNIQDTPTFVLDGIPTTGTAITGVGTGPSTGSGANIRIGRRADGVVQLDGAIQWFYIWNLKLNTDVLQGLTSSPWAVILPGVPRSRAVFLDFTMLQRDAEVPLDLGGLETRSRDAQLPLDFGGLETRSRDAQLPVEFNASLQRDPLLPLDLGGLETRNRDALLELALGGAVTRDARLPLDFGGIDTDTLLHRWNVLVKAALPLLHAWNVRKLAASFPITHTWDVLEPSAPLPHRWNVMPDVLTPFGVDPDTGAPLPGGAGDVQCPVATKDKTP